MQLPSIRLTFFVAFLSVLAYGKAARADAVERLTAQRLEAVHQAVAKLRSERQDVPRSGPWRDYRANLHVHSAFSHDSRGKIEEIVAAARAAGTQVLMFTEHPAEHYDFYEDGHRGIRDGVLLIPGAEMKGLLVYPRQSVGAFASAPVQEFSDLVRRRDGLTFLSHLEERMDWNLGGLTGVEIYNTHADFKDEKRFLSSLKNPLWLLSAAGLIRKYPQEAFSALHDYPADYLRRWDQLCQAVHHTGVAANDAHQNVGITVRLTDDQRARVEDALGEKLLELDATTLTALRLAPQDAKAGDVLFQLRLDPYQYSLRHAGTHLLLKELTQPEVWQALERGRAFVAFDWIADATGFDFAAQRGDERFEMGSRVPLDGGLRLTGRAPLAARWKLIRNGTLHSEAAGATFDTRVAEPGVYRAELWLDVAEEPHVWVLSNPLYVVAP